MFQEKQSKYPRSFNWQSYKKICTSILEECAIFVFHACYINVCVKFDDFFPNGERKEKPINVPIVKKIHRLERLQYAFLDPSKTLAFSDVIKIGLLHWRSSYLFLSRQKTV